MNYMRPRLRLLVAVLVTTIGPALIASDWPEWRGPNRDGTSAETNLPARWSPAGENLAWTLPFGGRSTPVIFGNRLYLQTTTGATTAAELTQTQERLVAVDVASGKVLWDRRFSLFLSDVPQNRAAWASPAVDTATGNIYLFTVAAELIALSPDGKTLWTRSLPEEYGAITTHGGRTTSPIIEGGKVILNTLLQGWGDLGRPGNRYFAFDKTTGQTVWIAAPQTKHHDTNYSSPIVATVNGRRLLMVGGTDGGFHGIEVNTGKPVWSIEVSKRAILNSVLFRDNTVFVTHGEENLDTTEMGMIAAVDATLSGALTGAAVRWKTHGFLPTYVSPVMDRERLYSVDNSAILGAFDLKTGKELWTKTLGTIQKGSPVLADGKLYIGTENGKFYILRPTATGAEVLDEDVLGNRGAPEPVLASPAIADGRVYVTSIDHVYAIGTRRPSAAGSPASPPSATASPGTGAAATVQVFPYEAQIAPGEKVVFTLRLFDDKGNFVRNEPATGAQWTVDQVAGTIGPDGTYVATASGGSAGYVKAAVGGVTGQARVRVIPPLPWTYDFEGIKAAPAWWTSNLKVLPRDLEGAGVLVRPRDDTVGRRTKVMMGRPDWSDYTMEVDVRGLEMRRQRGDVGLINQRYTLFLFGNAQKVELHPWQAANEMTVAKPFEWAVNTWYRLKLRVENRADGTTLVQGKIWPTAQPEPAAWTVEKIDKIPHRAGAPGIYGDGISDVFFDNLKVYRNR